MIVAPTLAIWGVIMIGRDSTNKGSPPKDEKLAETEQKPKSTSDLTLEEIKAKIHEFDEGTNPSSEKKEEH